MADLGLSDAMDAAEPLFDPVGVPGQVVVDHQMRAALKVHAFAGGVVGDHDPHDRIAVEGGDGGAARLARDAAMDDDDGRRRRRRGAAIFCCKIFERVLGSVKMMILRRRPAAGSRMIGSSRID